MTTTLRQATQGIARALNDLEQYVVTVGGNAQTTQVNRLQNANAQASPNRYDARWAFCSQGAGAEAQNVVQEGGYTPATGLLNMVNYWVYSLVAGDILDLTGLFPMISSTSPTGGTLGAATSYRDLAYEALRYLVNPDYLDVPTVANAQTYTLVAYATWLDRSERFTGELLDPPRAPGWPGTPTARRWEIRWDDAYPTIVFLDRAYPLNGHTFKVGVMRPGHTMINGLEQPSPPTAQADVLLPDLEDIVTVGLWLAYRTLAIHSFGRPSGNWIELATAQEEKVMRLTTFDRARWQQEQAAPAQSGAA